MLIKPTDLWSSSIGCCTVPTLDMEQYVSLQDRKETEVSDKAGEYLVKQGYGIEIKQNKKLKKEGV